MPEKSGAQISPGNDCDTTKSPARPDHPTFQYSVIPRSRLKYAGDRTFFIAEPSTMELATGLSQNDRRLQVFKKKLKTYLFIDHYGSDNLNVV